MPQNALRIAAPRTGCSSPERVLSIIARLKGNEGEIEEICRIAGIAGASVGILYESEVIYKHHHGFQNIATQEIANDNTLYGIGSCSNQELPTNVGNFLQNGHRAYNSGNGDHLIAKKYFGTYLQALKPATPFREKWIYNSHGYSIVGELLTTSTRKSLNSLLEEYVNKPLGLTRTATELDFENETNFAKPYSPLDDGTPFELRERQDFRGHFFEAAAGVHSTLDDILKLFQANMNSIHAATEPIPTSNVIKEPETLFSQHIPVLNPSFHERSYALGWIRTQLPGVAGVMGDNPRIFSMDELPVIGEGTESRLLLYHQGATVGYFPSLYQFPESKSGIAVLTNSIALGDQADWIAQNLTQVLFNDSKKVDWLALSEKTKNRCLAKYKHMKDTIASRENPGAPRNMDEYTRNYWDATGLFYIQVRRKPESDNTCASLFKDWRSTRTIFDTIMTMCSNGL
ncbi:beta-lactamase/transpeptidase-like protein [Cadophora sp. DSE1049]|nr:beta-lactamase/transpeptidase-like protein [Cadophora sp. DSE1049]